MFKSTFAIFILMHICNFCLCQNIIVFDTLTNNLLPYASISYKNSNKGKILQISHMGYETKMLNFNNSSDSVKIFLKPKLYNIKTIEISSKKNQKTYTLGYLKNRLLLPTTFTTSSMERRVIAAVLIKPNDTNDIISSAIVNIKHEEKVSDFKLYILTIGKDGYPKDTILKKLLNAENFKKRVNVDLEAHNISIPENGIFIAFEWGRYDVNERNQIKILTTKKYKNNHSYLYSNGEWYAFEKFNYANETNKNFNIGLKMIQR